MPSSFGHALVGLTAKKIVRYDDVSKKFLILSMVCPIIPDLDLVLIQIFNFPYHHVIFGHRYFSHSLTFALILALFVVGFFYKKEKPFSKRWFGLLLYFFVVTASHGVLDALTTTEYGVAFFSPFLTTRYFFPISPLLGAPSGAGFSLKKAFEYIATEILYVWIPCIIAIYGSLLMRKFITKVKAVLKRSHGTIHH